MTLSIIAPTTELDAVNALLNDIGEDPVSDLVDMDDDGLAALSYLQRVSREVQARGWHWNRERVELRADTNGEFLVSTNTIAADTSDEDVHIPVSLEGGKLRNLTPYKTGFDTFDKDVLKVETIVLKGFDLLPEVVRQYIYIAASRRFVESSEGVGRASPFSQADEYQAMAAVTRLETRQADARYPVPRRRRVPRRRGY